MADSEKNTFPQLLLQQASVRGNHPAIREKSLGIWQTYTWHQYLQQVRTLAGGLAALGFGRNTNLALVGENRPRLYSALLAVQSLGGVPVPLYQDAVMEEMRFVLQNADIEYAIVEDQEQVDKLLAARAEYPKLQYIIYDNKRGLDNYQEPGLMSLDSLMAKGETY
ncbi:MAG: AMP-binding protein, partial [Betaproteobacteria bacterium]|nr:AMP-binding protein [Betaproteobacteria bacterium]